jgi:hypothetical protein
MIHVLKRRGPARGTRGVTREVVARRSRQQRPMQSLSQGVSISIAGVGVPTWDSQAIALYGFLSHPGPSNSCFVSSENFVHYYYVVLPGEEKKSSKTFAIV